MADPFRKYGPNKLWRTLHQALFGKYLGLRYVLLAVVLGSMTAEPLWSQLSHTTLYTIIIYYIQYITYYTMYTVHDSSAGVKGKRAPKPEKAHA